MTNFLSGKPCVVTYPNFIPPKAPELRGHYGAPTKRQGVFIDFGIDCVELRDGIGHYTSAIVLFEDGTLDQVGVSRINFLEEVKQ